MWNTWNINVCIILSMQLFFNCYLAAPHPTLDHYQGSNFTHPMLITVIYIFLLEGHWEPHNEVACLSPAECLVGFEWGSFWFWLQCTSNCFQRKHLFGCLLEKIWNIDRLRDFWSKKYPGIVFLYLKGCVCYIFASLLCMFKKEHLWKCFLFHFKSYFRLWDNQV